MHTDLGMRHGYTVHLLFVCHKFVFFLLFFFLKKYTVCHLSQQEAVERAKSQLGIVFLELDWEDTTSFIISDADLTECVKFIHSAITSGGSVLVHCAQVRLHMSIHLNHVHSSQPRPYKSGCIIIESSTFTQSIPSFPSGLVS